MQRYIILIAFTFMLTSFNLNGFEVENIPAIIKENATDSLGISIEEQMVAKEIQEMGEDAISQLLPLLEHEKKSIRKLTAFTLSEIDGLNEMHLDQLKRAVMNDVGWLESAIAKIGSKEAIEFLVERLKKETSIHNQSTWAFVRLETKGLPYLIDLIQTDSDNESVMNIIMYVFQELNSKASSSIPALIENISNPNSKKSTIKYSILALGAIGEEALQAESIIISSKYKKDEDIKDAISESLKDMRSPKAVKYLLEKLKNDPQPKYFADIAELREVGIKAGKNVSKYLRSPDWEVRVAAARTLGFIGYKKSSKKLISLLNTPNDWILVKVSVEALGMLQSNEAVPHLINIKENYWYSDVRDTAGLVIEKIKSNDLYEIKTKYETTNQFWNTFFYYNKINYSTKSILPEFMNLNKNKLAKDELSQIEYKYFHNYYGDVSRKPDIGIKVDNIMLVGRNSGEWGGELVLIDNKNNKKVLLIENVHGIHKVDNYVLVVTGLAHLDLNKGMIYRVDISKIDYKVEKWIRLPGAPKKSGVLLNGNIFVSCYGGDINISRDGRIQK